jgi:signal transduction histidine kinase
MALETPIQNIIKNRLFTGVKDSVLTSFFYQKEIKEADEGELLYKTGDSGNSIFLIITGEVKVKFPNQNYITTKIHNDFFGEKEFVDGTKRISSAMAFSKLLYYEIDKKSYNKLIQSNSAIEDNLMAFGEFKLPKSVIDYDKKFTLTDRDKPVSVKLKANGKIISEESDKDMVPPSVMTQQLLPDLESIGNSFEDEVIDSTVENLELDKALKELQQVNTDEPEENFDLPAEEKIQESKQPEEIDVEENKSEIIEEIPAKSDIKSEAKPETVESGINREIVRKILLALNRLYSGITIVELLKNVKRALKDLTNSESTDLIFVEEKLLRMYRVIVKDAKTKNEYFEITEGLTGLCSNEKKPINFDRPTADSRFNSNIDYPGPARLKSILYFPIISDAGETVAVLQTARETNKFTENEILYLTMISKQLETAITRVKTINQLLYAERINSGKKLREIINREIRIPIDIIESYIKVLHSKDLPEDVDDLIRMILKQSSSVVDLTESILKILLNENILSDTKLHFNEFIDDVLELFSEYCESKDVKLFKKIGEGAVLEIDRSKMYTAILQLIKAAVADCRKGDRIYLSTELNDDIISVIIQNEGKGAISLPEEELIDYFYLKENVEESNVNLLIAKKIINAHSGQVEIESIKGVGCNIKIALPVAR